MKISAKNLSIIVGGIILIIALAYVLPLFKKTTIRNLDSTGTSIVAFGDSLVQGVGASPQTDFVSVLSNRLNTPIVNLGISGNTTADGLARLDTIFTYNPKIVIVLLGGNDYLKRVPIDDMFNNLAKIVDSIQARGAAVLLLGVRGGALTDIYEDRFKSFATAHGVAFVPNVLDGLLGHTEYMYDSIHPNTVGYAKIADKIEPVLRDLIEKIENKD